MRGQRQLVGGSGLLTVALAVAASVAVAVALSTRQEREYEATATLELRDRRVDTELVGTFVPEEGQSADERTEQAAQVVQDLQRPEVFAAVRRELRRPLSDQRLSSMLNPRSQGVGGAVAVSARSQDPELAAQVANAAARAEVRLAAQRTARRYRRAADDTRAQLRSAGPLDLDRRTIALYRKRVTSLEALASLVRTVKLQSAATVPADPIAPRPLRDGLVAALLGLLVGGLIVVARGRIERLLTTDERVTSDLDLAVLGSVSERLLGRTVRPEDASTAADLEPFRIIRKNLEVLRGCKPLGTVAVTSAVADEGKSTVATSLALAEAASGSTTLLVDCDLRNPSVAERVGVPSSPGLVDWLEGRASLPEIVQGIELPPGVGGATLRPSNWLHCIAGGEGGSDLSAELLGSEAFARLLSQLGASYDLVVLDSAPLLAVSDTLEYLPNVQAVLLCLRAGRTTRIEAREARSLLGRMPRRPTGLVLTGSRTELRAGYLAPA